MQPTNKNKSNPEIEKHIDQSYKYGFVTDIESETIPPGLDEDVIRLISSKKINRIFYSNGDSKLSDIG